MIERPVPVDSLPATTTLDNGARLLVTHMPHARSVSLSIYVAAGSRYEQPDESGLSHFLEHVLFKGTERRPRPIDISIEIDAMGGTINAGTNRELTSYYAKVTPEHAERCADVLADMLLNSLCRDEEIERERHVILEELAAVEDSPAEQAGLLVDSLLWPDQPHGRDIAGTPDSVRALRPQQVVDYYRKQYVANAAVISIAGALSVAEAQELAAEAFGGWAPGEPNDWIRDVPAEDGPHGGVITKQTEQAHLAIGLRGIGALDDDRYALNLLSIILGEGMSSRLFVRLREQLGLCYDIHSYLAHLRDTGMIGIYAGVDPDDVPATLREIGRELGRAREAVSTEELERAKAITRSRTYLRMEDTRSVSALYGSQSLLDLPLTTPEETVAKTDAVTVDDVARVAHRLIREDGLYLAVVGPYEDAAPLQACLMLEG